MKDTRSIDERFADFHARHLGVYAMFTAFAERAKARGHTRYSADALIALVRWETNHGDKAGEDYRISDHYVSRYARMLMRERPEFAGFFETRKLRAVAG